MAREPSVRSSDSGSHDQSTDDRQSVGTFDRRSVLKLTGATAAAASGLGAASASGAAAGDYDVVKARGQTIRVGAGETWENKLIDFSTGRHIHVRASGDGWTIRNIGFKGRMTDGSQTGAIFNLRTPRGGTGVIENVYYTDGANRNQQLGYKFIFIPSQSAGHIVARNLNWQNVTSTSFYAQPGGRDAPRGRLTVENCFAANNRVDSLRTAGPNDVVRNCHFLNTRGGEHGGRLLRTTHGTTTVENCHFECNGQSNSLVAGPNGTIEFESGEWDRQRAGRGTIRTGSGVGTNPDPQVPDGVPRSPEEAASGAAGTGDGGTETGDGDAGIGDDGRVYRIEGTVDYRFEVDGRVEPHPDYAQWLHEGTAYGDDWADWYMNDAHTEWLVDGDVVSFEYDDTDEGAANFAVYRDGTDVTDDFVEGDEGDHVLYADGVAGRATEYTLSVDGGPIEPSAREDATINDNISISDDGTEASGLVWAGADAWTFDGDLTDLDVDGPATFFLDGDEIDPDGV